MATIKHEELEEEIRAIIFKASDLASLSSKKIRRQLEEKHDCDLSDRKKEVDEIIMRSVKEKQDNEAKQNKASASQDEATNGDTQSDSDESDFDQPDDEPPKKKVKSSKQNDEELAKKLQEEEEQSARKTRGGRSRPPPTKKAKREGGGGAKGKSGYSQPMQLSPALAEVVGASEMARSDVVKKMWEIIRERNLMDPKNKQFMVCDEELYKIFRRKRVRTFGMMKYLKDHIYKPGERDEQLLS